MKSKIVYKIALIILVMLVIMANVSWCLATSDNFDFTGFEDQTANDTIQKPVKKVVGAALSIIRIVGTGVAIIILAFFGMKYMMAAPGERADFKKGAVQYVVGAIIVFGASNILAVLVSVVGNVLE